MEITRRQIIDLWESLPTAPNLSDDYRWIWHQKDNGYCNTFEKFAEILCFSDGSFRVEIFWKKLRKFMYSTPLDKVPLYVNEEGYDPYVKWRLKNGI